jgi:hypothetical protein
MKRLLAVVVLGGVVLTQVSIVSAQSEHLAHSALVSGSLSGDVAHLPPLPQGRSTIMGGAIQNVDPVRDQFFLRVFGERPMTILFDERTQVYRDGKRIPLRELGSEDHASVQTVLDGSDVFALSVHILSQAPQGECQGQVVSFNPDTRELAVSSVLSPSPITLLVPANTPITRVGQASFTSQHSGLSDLAVGSLVSVTFAPVQKAPAVASHVDILATPGSQFLLAGDIAYLDTHSGQLDLVDPRDEKSYQIYFDPARIPASRNLHLGDHVRIAATYKAAHYVADDITIY